MAKRFLGCGRFSEHEWADAVTGHGPGAALLEHVPHCPACRAEMAAYTRLQAQVRDVVAEADETLHGALRAAFVDGVMAEVAEQRRGAEERSRADRQRRAPRWATTAPAWAAACVVLFILLFGGLRGLLPDGGEQSVGEAWPGGTILKMSDVFATAQAAGLTTAGVVEAAVVGAADFDVATFSAPERVPEFGGAYDDGIDALGIETDSFGVSIMSMPVSPGVEVAGEAPASTPPGAPIRVSSGFVSASSDTPTELEGGFSVQ